MQPIVHSTIAKLKSAKMINDSDIVGGKLSSEAAKKLYKKNIRVHHTKYSPNDKHKYFHDGEIVGGKLQIGNAFKKFGSVAKHGFENANQKIQQFAENAVDKAGDFADTAIEKGAEFGQKAIEKTSDYVDTVMYGRGDYPPKVRDLIAKYGDKVIRSIVIDRTPVQAVLKGALNVISKGAFLKRLGRTPYDEIFHLRIDITFDDNSTIALEKNEVINMYTNPVKKEGGEQKQVERMPAGITLNKLLEGGQKLQGNKWFGYSAYNNNCQDFILALLKGSGIGTEQDYNFVKQDTSSLFKGDSFLRKFSNTVTKIGAKANEITQGSGIEQPYKSKSTNKSNRMKMRTYDTDSDTDSDSDYEICGNGLSDEKAILKQMKMIEKQIAAHHKIHGGKIQIAKAFGKLGKTVKGGFEDVTGREFKSPEEMRETFMVNDAKRIGNRISAGAKKAGYDVDDYITSKRGGLASDLVKYGIPATTGAVFGALGTVAGLNPVGGVAATALGSKLGAVAANQITKKTGVGLHIDINSHNAKRDIAGGKIAKPRGRRSSTSALEQLLTAHEKKQDKLLKKNLLGMSKSVTQDIKDIKSHIGAGFTGRGRGRPAKGSAEAKERMARIRAMKKK